jgi:tellurite resistance protein TerC
MNPEQISYLTFSILILLALVFDLGLLSKRHTVVTMKKAMLQTLFWVVLALLFCFFLWFQEGSLVATKFFTAYLMEWSLSIDNIFVFILIFAYFKVNELDAARALLIGILLAIVFRIIFIALGIGLIQQFHWLLYLFGVFLLYTGWKLFFRKDEAEFDPGKTKIYSFMSRYLRLSELEPDGRFFLTMNKKVWFTSLAMVVVMLAVVDIAFALDSIPTVVSLVRDDADKPFTGQDILVIYSSNIFAVLGLRSLFFLLRSAVDQFDFLQQGIAIVLAFIGVKMLVEYWDIHISIFVSLAVILLCLTGSIVYSIHHKRKMASRGKIG